jgi:hypothetical protein
VIFCHFEDGGQDLNLKVTGLKFRSVPPDQLKHINVPLKTAATHAQQMMKRATNIRYECDKT